MTIEDRLKEERGRLGFNQPDFAALAGRTKKTLIDYEKGATSPDAKFLAAIAAVGADVQYILTGIRSINAPSMAYQSSQSEAYIAAQQKAPYTVTLRPDQAALLDNVEHCAKEDQEAIKRMAFIAAKADNKDEAQQGKKKRA